MSPRAGVSRVAAWLRTTTWSARLARGGAALVVIEATAIGVAYLSQIVFARSMGAREYGTYSYVIGWATVLGVLPALGLPDAVLRFIPQYAARRDWSRLRGMVRAARLVCIGAGIAVAVTGALIVAFLDARDGITFARAMILGICAAPLLGLMNLHTAILRSLMRVGPAFFPAMLLRPLLVMGSAVLLLGAGYALTSLSLLGATVVVLAVILLVQLVMYRSARPGDVAGARPGYDLRGWLGTALPLLLVAGCGAALSNTGLLVVGALSGPVDAGLYNAAARTATLMNVVLSMSNAVAAPQFAVLHGQGDRAGLQALTIAVTRWGFWPSLVVAGGLVLLAGPLLALFGRAFVGARLVLAILAVGHLANTGAGPVGMLLNMTGHHGASLRVNACAAAINLVLTVVGVLCLGLVGAALASAATMAISNLWQHRIVVRELGVHASILYPFALARGGARS